MAAEEAAAAGHGRGDESLNDEDFLAGVVTVTVVVVVVVGAAALSAELAGGGRIRPVRMTAGKATVAWRPSL